jgi:hypothetical protein
MAYSPKNKWVSVASIFLSDLPSTTHFFRRSNKIFSPYYWRRPLCSSNWLGTTLIDYLIHRFLTPCDLDDKTVIPSLEFMDQMALQMDKLDCNEQGQKDSVKKQDRSLISSLSGSSELLLLLCLMAIFLYYQLRSMPMMMMFLRKYLYSIVYVLLLGGSRFIQPLLLPNI